MTAPARATHARDGGLSGRVGEPLRIGYLWQYSGEGVLWPEGGAGSPPECAAAIHIRGVVGALRRSGHAVSLVALKHGTPHWSDDSVTWQPAAAPGASSSTFRAFESVVRGVQRRLHLPFVRFFDSLHFADGCADALAGVDVLYERFWILNYGGLMLARRLGVPLVVEVNGDIVEELIQQRLPASRAQWAAIRAATRFALRRADHVVAVSETLRARLIDRWGVDASRVTAVSNGTDVAPLSGLDPHAVRRRHAIGAGSVVIFIGNFMPWHGTDILLQAFRRLRDQADLDAALVLVGDGPLRMDAERQAASLGLGDSVRFTGNLPHAEAKALLAAADIAVLCNTPSPTAAAGSPLKLFEYMAAGRAIVASALPNVSTVLTHGRNAWLVPPGDPPALGDALAILLRDGQLRRTLGDEARAEAVAKHSWDRVGSDLLRIFGRVRARRGDGSTSL